MNAFQLQLMPPHPDEVDDDSDFYEVDDDPEPRRYRLADEGQTWNGEGESYAERNA